GGGKAPFPMLPGRLGARMDLLCGDIGGTSTRLALWQNGALKLERVYPSTSFSSLETPLREWLAEVPLRPTSACLGVPGPVVGNRCVTTNLPWVVDGEELSFKLGFPVRLINDFHAAARGISLLDETDRVQIRAGDGLPGAPVAVLGAGTGLGQAHIVGTQVLPGEGGHSDFAPANALERDLAAWLETRVGLRPPEATAPHVCWEDVLSGPGLLNIHLFLCARRGRPEPWWVNEPDAPARVSEVDPEAVRMFWGFYGAEAGNMALRLLTRGGVYLCGGIAPRLLDALPGSDFEQRFSQKGALSHALEGIPVFVVRHPSLGLLGAAAEGILQEKH
ncbi:MAG TPA: glucokinase, partial [Myxococcota bacterium]|nr:glucokinase [Myxococcota bacterium]